MLKVFESRRSIITRPLVDRVHQPKGDHKQHLAVDQACFPMGEIGWLVINEFQSLFEPCGLNEGEDCTDIGVLHPEEPLRKIEWR